MPSITDVIAPLTLPPAGMYEFNFNGEHLAVTELLAEELRQGRSGVVIPATVSGTTDGIEWRCYSCLNNLAEGEVGWVTFESGLRDGQPVYRSIVHQNPNCMTEYVFECQSCNNIVSYRNDSTRVARSRTNDDYSLYEYNSYCRACINNGQVEFYYCNRCGNRFDYSLFDHDEDVCRNCEENRDSDRGSVIRSYGYKPSPRFMYGDGVLLRQPTQEATLFLGAEIELEMRNLYSNDLESTAKETSLIVGREAYLKHDGSLDNGFEVVTHPGTIDWWHEPENVVLAALKNLLGRCKSYHSSNCGMHIHMSKDAFTSFHLMRFLHFVYNNQYFVEFIAQRRSTSYANFSNYEKNTIVRHAKEKYSSNGRFVAVNLENSDTIELRVFKGNLEPFRILKNIEFAQALYEYTKEEEHMTSTVLMELNDTNPQGIALYTKDLTPRGFKNWVSSRETSFPHLNEYLAVWKGR